VATTPDPIGLDIARTGRLISRGFDDQLSAAGGSLPTWLIAVSLMRDDHTMQRDIASAIGIEGATLTHHLNKLETAGLVTRHRTPENRRSQLVELTERGQALFFTLLDAVIAFDRQLCEGFTATELDTLHGYLERLRTNVIAPAADGATKVEDVRVDKALHHSDELHPAEPAAGIPAAESSCSAGK
jgi:MarR family transcriptional regulator, transcriptional regulator for hemolysin